MGEILLILYCVAGYWACGKTIYANKIRIGKASSLFMTRFIWGALFGWILIPAAILKVIIFK